VQTFLPFADFEQSAKVLDRQRLGKQRVENLQILSALIFPSYGWQSHPAVGIWRGCGRLFLAYQTAICTEWTRRGYADSCLEKTHKLLADRQLLDGVPTVLGHEPFHAAHRAALLYKNFDHYKQFDWLETPKLEYIWKLPQT